MTEPTDQVIDLMEALRTSLKRHVALVPSLEARVNDALMRLGPTTSDVARNLDAAGIRGLRGAGGCCPIARYLRRTLSLGSVSVGYDGTIFIDRFCYAIVAPEPVQAFVRRFDRLNEFPELDERFDMMLSF